MATCSQPTTSLGFVTLTIYNPMCLPIEGGTWGPPFWVTTSLSIPICRGGLCPFWKFAKKGLVKNCTTWFLKSCLLHLFVLGDWSDIEMHTHQNIGTSQSFCKSCDMQPTHHFSWIWHFWPCIYPCPPFTGGAWVPPLGLNLQIHQNRGEDYVHFENLLKRVWSKIAQPGFCNLVCCTSLY